GTSRGMRTSNVDVVDGRLGVVEARVLEARYRQRRLEQSLGRHGVLPESDREQARSRFDGESNLERSVGRLLVVRRLASSSLAAWLLGPRTSAADFELRDRSAFEEDVELVRFGEASNRSLPSTL